MLDLKVNLAFCILVNQVTSLCLTKIQHLQRWHTEAQGRQKTWLFKYNEFVFYFKAVLKSKPFICNSIQQLFDRKTRLSNLNKD